MKPEGEKVRFSPSSFFNLLYLWDSHGNIKSSAANANISSNYKYLCNPNFDIRIIEMNNLSNIFSTREIAIFIWFLILLIFAIRTKEVRNSIVRVIKAFFNRKLFLAFCTLLIYIPYLQPIITQYFIDNKSEIWLLFLIAHSKR